MGLAIVKPYQMLSETENESDHTTQGDQRSTDVLHLIDFTVDPS